MHEIVIIYITAERLCNSCNFWWW